MRTTSILLLTALLALLALPAWAQEGAPSDPGLVQDEALTEPATVEDDGIHAATPSDESALKVLSIRRNEYYYQSYGRKDLFGALVTGEFEPVTAAEVVDMNTAKLVGVMWGATDKFALLEDGEGNGYILRTGDRVRNGRVVAIHEDSVVASVSLYGITSRVILRLENREG